MIWQALLVPAPVSVRTRITPAPLFVAATEGEPATLSTSDITLYQLSFAAEEKNDFTSADQLMAQLGNRRLVGHLLAARYLSDTYTASREELADWLAHYRDHPEAARISKLATSHGMAAPAIRTETPLRGDGYADHLGRSGMPDGWYRALSLWRDKNYEEAYPLFAAVGEDDSLGSWQRAAGDYWAYRAADAQDETKLARQHLASASQYKTTFYGLLAAQQVVGAPELSAQAPHVSARLRDNPQAIRAALLVQIGRTEDAENQLRHLYSTASRSDRPGLVTLAHELGLANLQVRLASMEQLSEDEEIFASFPAPDFVLDAQTDLDAALMLAIARNESSFRDSVSSSAGARGIMQIMPATARGIERHVGLNALTVASTDTSQPLALRLNDPATSVRYSSEYLKILAREPNIGQNLIRVLAAYNAGPGAVSGWGAAAAKMDDPLLYIESIPYAETRNYVMQVMAQYWVYQLIRHETPRSLAALSRGHWPDLARRS